MPKSKSWPHQKFHNANKSTDKSSSSIWESCSYLYNNSGKIEKIYYKWGSGATNSPSSLLYQASYTGTKQNCNFYSVKNNRYS
ncbi:hypothetical protein [Wolbachia endosymbiont of Cantharis cryptica]|uniref:hypothetical protein n=1 Tax=Wolbachia endosymbiont of Cantharis cryptica TaxID=3066132 RepID=UPI00376EED1E